MAARPARGRARGLLQFLLVQADQNDPSMAAVFQVSPHVRLDAGQPIYLTITPGAGASQGSGKIILRASPTT